MALKLALPILANYIDPAFIGLALLAVLLITLLTNKFNQTLVCSLICIAFVVTGTSTLGEAFSAFSQNTIIMLFGVLIIGEAMMDSELATIIGNWCIKMAKGRERRFILMALAAITVLSAFLDDTAMMAVFLSILVAAKGASGGKFSMLNMTMVMSVGSLVGGQLTLVGCTTNINGNALLQALTGLEFTMFSFTLANWPILALEFIFMLTIGFKLMKKIWGDRADDAIDFSNIKELGEVNRDKAIKMCVILGIMLFGFITQIVPTGITALICACLCWGLGVCGMTSSLKSMNWSIFLRMGCLFSIANCLGSCGFSELVANWFLNTFGNNISPYFVFAIATFLALVLSQVMGNSAVITVLGTPLLPVAMALGINPKLFMMGIINGASFAYLLPLAGACISLSQTAGYRFSDYVKFNWFMTIAAYLVTILYVPLIYPLMG